ncbi:vanadium-dependent haloperoxidase [Flavitalea antarctica]
MRTKLIILLLTVCNLGNAQKKVVPQNIDPNEAEYLHRIQLALTEVIVHDIFSPPVASRIYLYANLSAYEVLALEKNKLTSCENLRSFPSVSKIIFDKSQVYLPLAAMSAFVHTSNNLIFSEGLLQDSAKQIFNSFRNKIRNKKHFDSSIAFGKRVADSVLSFAAKDNYRETRSMRRYSVNSLTGRWIPTPPAYIAAVEPHWGKVHTFLIDSASQFKPPVPIAYTHDIAGRFYIQALEVYNTVKNITPEQKAIASFWDCNPFFVNTSGHLVFATKKLSPGGHWMSIAGIAARSKSADIFTASKAYTFTAIALYDAFISCWDEKYRSNYIRPETFINSRIDESWRPLLQTPPFPEYTSGHSVISTAAAVVLTKLFGDKVAIEDNSEVPYGLPVRSFNSFQSAADEAAMSRLYGGIHFREAIENGKLQGSNIGNCIATRLMIAETQ